MFDGNHIGRYAEDKHDAMHCAREAWDVSIYGFSMVATLLKSAMMKLHNQ
jgi:hypothetical protein